MHIHTSSIIIIYLLRFRWASLQSFNSLQACTPLLTCYLRHRKRPWRCEPMMCGSTALVGVFEIAGYPRKWMFLYQNYPKLPSSAMKFGGTLLLEKPMRQVVSQSEQPFFSQNWSQNWTDLGWSIKQGPMVLPWAPATLGGIPWCCWQFLDPMAGKPPRTMAGNGVGHCDSCWKELALHASDVKSWHWTQPWVLVRGLACGLCFPMFSSSLTIVVSTWDLDGPSI